MPGTEYVLFVIEFVLSFIKFLFFYVRTAFVQCTPTLYVLVAVSKAFFDCNEIFSSRKGWE